MSEEAVSDHRIAHRSAPTRSMADHGTSASYLKLGLAISINAVVMFVLTYALIDTVEHFYANINRVYMSVMMVAPMVTVMLLVMWSMYPNATLNIILLAAFAALFVGTFALARTQTPVGNEQFLRSMIPHHSSAILMCDNPRISDPEIITLCEGIVETQKKEIAQMKAILQRY